MGILIGMDEAGYGPNYGPLVVAATAWEAPEGGSGFGIQDSDIACDSTDGATATAVRSTKRRSCDDCVDLYRLLRTIVAKSASERRIAIADSKALYHPGLGLRQLERGVHAVLMAMRETPACWSAIVRYCEADAEGHHRRVCWPEGFDCPLPIDATADELARLAARLARACEACGIRPVAVRARLVFAEQFNELVDYYGTKGAALSHVTVGLLRDVLNIDVEDTGAGGPPSKAGSPSESPTPSPQPPVYAVCDKHGGRNYYAALLQHHFSDHWVQPVFEARDESRYEWGQPGSRVSVAFRMNGESFLPTALASMTAKYLRELAMLAFNEFWQTHVPDLRPTAGYPADAHRFRKAIRPAQRKLGIDDHVLWRKK